MKATLITIIFLSGCTVQASLIPPAKDYYTKEEVSFALTQMGDAIATLSKQVQALQPPPQKSLDVKGK